MCLFKPNCFEGSEGTLGKCHSRRQMPWRGLNDQNAFFDLSWRKLLRKLLRRTLPIGIEKITKFEVWQWCDWTKGPDDVLGHDLHKVDDFHNWIMSRVVTFLWLISPRMDKKPWGHTGTKMRKKIKNLVPVFCRYTCMGYFLNFWAKTKGALVFKFLKD